VLNKYLIVLLFWASIPSGMLAQASEASFLFDEPMPFVITQNSRLWLEGSASVVDFQCHASSIITRGALEGLDTLSQVPAPHGELTLQVRVPVGDLDCGRSGINRDMRNTLNARSHPYIVYTLDSNELLGLTTEDELFVFDINTWGKLQISGHERTEKIRVTGKFLGPWQFQIRGSHLVKMSDYGLTPPSPMMGLIKVDDTMEVHFDVTFCLRSCEPMTRLRP